LLFQFQLCVYLLRGAFLFLVTFDNIVNITLICGSCVFAASLSKCTEACDKNGPFCG